MGAHPDDETFGLGATLAYYAAAGVKVYCACATRGEAGSISPRYMQGYTDPGDLRWAELKCAGEALGLTDVIHLGYRDSGMSGSPDNKHHQALAAAPVEEVAGRVVRLIRQLRPQVVITSDPIGGYRHPDHIAVHKATLMAFNAAGDPKRYPEAGAAFQPQKLYYNLFPRGWLKLMVRLLPIMGKDPHRFGRNKDIDLAALAAIDFPVHAAVPLSRQAMRRRDKAMICHASQAGGGPPLRGLLNFIRLIFGQRELYMRAYPAPDGKRREKDLFEGVK